MNTRAVAPPRPAEPVPGLDPRLWPVTDESEIRAFFRRANRHVVHFAGYGELGYQDPTVVERVVAEVLGERPAAEVFAHGGTLLRAGGQDGSAAPPRGRCAGPRSRCGSWDSGAIVPGRTAGRQRRVPCRAAPPCAGGQPGLRAVICRYSAW